MQYIINTDLYLSLVFTSESNQILYTVLRLEKEKSNTVRNILWNSVSELKKKSQIDRFWTQYDYCSKNAKLERFSSQITGGFLRLWNIKKELLFLYKNLAKSSQ